MKEKIDAWAQTRQELETALQRERYDKQALKDLQCNIKEAVDANDVDEVKHLVESLPLYIQRFREAEEAEESLRDKVRRLGKEIALWLDKEGLSEELVWVGGGYIVEAVEGELIVRERGVFDASQGKIGDNR